jgi:plasmid replication initiation protein
MQNKSLVVVKSNKVIEASYRLTISEQRVLLACIAQIDSKGELTPYTEFEISAADINNLSGLDSIDNAYKTLKLATNRLFERFIVIDDPDPDNPKIKQRRTRWITAIDYVPGDGKVILSFATKIIPYLSQLSREFTQYKLEHVSRFESMYSLRLYELLMQWIKIGKRDIEIDWLKVQLQVDDKYDRVTFLQKRVINVAVDEINQHSNIWVKYTKRKAGRVITHFLFTFGLKEPEKPKITEEYIRKHARIGESWADATKRLKQKQE